MKGTLLLFISFTSILSGLFAQDVVFFDSEYLKKIDNYSYVVSYKVPVGVQDKGLALIELRCIGGYGYAELSNIVDVSNRYLSFDNTPSQQIRLDTITEYIFATHKYKLYYNNDTISLNIRAGGESIGVDYERVIPFDNGLSWLGSQRYFVRNENLEKKYTSQKISESYFQVGTSNYGISPLRQFVENYIPIKPIPNKVITSDYVTISSFRRRTG